MRPPSLGSAGPAIDRGAAHVSDSQLDSAWTDSALASEPTPSTQETTWQHRPLIVVALLVGSAVFALALELARWPTPAATWRATAAGALALDAGAAAPRQDELTQILREIRADDAPSLAVDASLLPRSARWIVGDVERGERIVRQDELGKLLQHPVLALRFADAQVRQVPIVPRTLGGLGPVFWTMSALALALCLAGALVLLTRRTLTAAMYSLLVLCQAANLLLMAIEAVPVLGWPPGFTRLDLALRISLDLASAAALLSVCLLALRQMRRRRATLAAVWTIAIAIAVAGVADRVPQLWWVTQALMLAYAAGSVEALRLATAREPRPYTALMWRLTIAAGATFALLTAAVAASQHDVAAVQKIGILGPVAWTLFFVALLMLVPFVVRARTPARELALLAGAGTLAISMHLLLVSLSGLGQAESLALALFASALAYAASRPWLLGELAGGGAAPSGEKLFDSLYRAARDIEHAPGQATAHVTRLLRELFDPLDIGPHVRNSAHSRVSPDGSTLVVPLPRLPGADTEAEPEGSLRLRLAQRGARLFTREDARLIDRLLEQLRRAVAFDRAVEHGRTEERTRIAQDLHDDIGARLLTLMYKAQDPEMEEYLRHTLQDLKTLTRGLAASNHRLSHAAAEWKADLTLRLNATHCAITWSFTTDREVALTVMQWSGLTRILRELVNNIIAHAQASEVEILAQCEDGRLVLTVCDDGIGRAPEAWSHGLGLGGVRKRVRALGGQVGWYERPGRGIRCEVRLPLRDDSA